MIIKTSFGDIEIELFSEKSPQTVKNFLHYVEQGYYDNCIFHRVIANFVIQSGGFGQGFTEKNPSEPAIQNESTNELSNVKGTLAMARTNDPHSAKAQFFINVVDNTFLDYQPASASKKAVMGYAVFGKVLESSMTIVEKIAAQPTGNRSYHTDVPLDEIYIKTIVK